MHCTRSPAGTAPLQQGQGPLECTIGASNRPLSPSLHSHAHCMKGSPPAGLPFELAKTLLPSAVAAAHMRAYKEPGRQMLPVVNTAVCRSPVIPSPSTSQQLFSRQGSPIRQAAAAALAAADNGCIGSTSAPRPLLLLVAVAVLCSGTAALAATLLLAHLHPGAAVGLSSSGAQQQRCGCITACMGCM